MCVWVCQSVCVCVCVWSNLIWTTGRHRNATTEASFDVIYGTTEGHLLVGCLRSEGNWHFLERPHEHFFLTKILLKGKFTQKWKLCHHVGIPILRECWASLTAKQLCNTLPNTWSRWGLEIPKWFGRTIFIQSTHGQAWAVSQGGLRTDINNNFSNLGSQAFWRFGILWTVLYGAIFLFFFTCFVLLFWCEAEKVMTEFNFFLVDLPY